MHLQMHGKDKMMDIPSHVSAWGAAAAIIVFTLIVIELAPLSSLMLYHCHHHAATTIIVFMLSKSLPCCHQCFCATVVFVLLPLLLFLLS